MINTRPSRRGRRKSNNWIRSQLNLAYHMAGEPFKCHWCRTHLPVRYLTVDHLVPRWQGGHNGPSNAVFACGRCNSLRDGWQRHRAGLAGVPKKSLD